LSKNASQGNQPEFQNIRFYDKLWKVVVRDLKSGEEKSYVTPFVSIASGHHATPIYADFPGQETFPGKKKNLVLSINIA
jgi:cation diffusion facilitator CzcD-associated flavoprotein CzcO